MGKTYIALTSLIALILSTGANFSWIPGPPIVKLFLSFWS